MFFLNVNSDVARDVLCQVYTLHCTAHTTQSTNYTQHTASHNYMHRIATFRQPVYFVALYSYVLYILIINNCGYNRLSCVDCPSPVTPGYCMAGIRMAGGKEPGVSALTRS